MIKEAKNADFYTTGRQPSEQEFALISEWINKDTQKQATRKGTKMTIVKRYLAPQTTANSGTSH